MVLEEEVIGWKLTANSVLNSTRPTAALRLFPLNSRYPTTRIDNAERTIRAICQSPLPEFSLSSKRGEGWDRRTHRYHLVDPFDLLLGSDNLIQSLLQHHYEPPLHLDHLRNRMMSIHEPEPRSGSKLKSSG